MKEMPEDKRKEDLRLWLSGHTYRQVYEDLGISLGAVSKIVEEARTSTPDLEELRRLNTILKKSGLSAQDAIRGSALLDRYGVSLDALGLMKVSESVVGEKVRREILGSLFL